MEGASQKISPFIQEKLEKFEPDGIKRKAEHSTELTRKEKKKLKNQEKHAAKQQQLQVKSQIRTV